MATTTLGLKVDEGFRERLKAAADTVGRTPHWFIKQAVLSWVERVERGAIPPEALGAPADDGEHQGGALVAEVGATRVQPFLEFAQSVAPQSVLRAAITAACRRDETECLPVLLHQARLAPALAEQTGELARRLVGALRARRASGGVEGLLQEFSLSSQEGVALMCLAEALLRIPDRATRDALIRDKISHGDWNAHLGQSPSMFVNATTWGLMLTGRLVGTTSEKSLTSALTRMIGKGGEPLIRKGVDMAMRLMGEQFVTGETISEALANSRRFESRGFRYSYDMLGEAATTAADAQRYYDLYEQAIHAIGKASAGRGIYEGPGISVKLSALHPRYGRQQQERVMGELLPRMRTLARLARSYDIGLNIDAEEADRLEISLDLLEALCFDPGLKGWNGIGFVVQAYQKRAPSVIDYVVDLARRSRHRIMVRLVKGAYWDSEIKRAQVDGLEGYPVYTRKVHTDVSYLACARRLLAAPQAVYPQFATHNAHTLAAIYHLAGQNYYPGQYEFQCLHGMGEPLYEQVTGAVADGRLNRPCRIYAPVGTHETLLAYLVRRLLENGANTSFVNRIADPKVDIAALVADPVAEAERIVPVGAPHPRIPLPVDLYRDESGRGRANSAGLDLSSEQRLASLSAALLGSTASSWQAAPLIDGAPVADAASRAEPVRNPADRRDIVGHVVPATAAEVQQALAQAVAAAPIWQATPAAERAACLQRAADALEAQMQLLLGLIVREAGKTLANAIAEVREAVDFLRYYGAQAAAELSNDTHRPLGPVVCISPWNFPLAIFTGQVAAALAAGNTVLAKPAEQTPLIAAVAVRILHAAGVPAGALQLLPGDGGTVGAALAADARVRGVMFTGSTDVARGIARTLADRLDDRGHTIPLVAETGGQNAMVVDSSALPEQVVMDVLNSAFDSAGQRCSALRVLCLQEEIADRVLGMLRGALHELSVGSPDLFSVDVGPVIDAEARDAVERHVAAFAAAGRRVERLALPPAAAHGTFVAPAIIEIDDVAELQREVFGPVLHVVRYRREDIDVLIDAINATGYGLTFGLHTRIDETIARVVPRIRAGNVYVNRNIVGAVVGVQPFGGEGLSGTGPKAGGPLYLHRLLATGPAPGQTQLLPGPTGERNAYTVRPRGTVLCIAATPAGAAAQWDAVQAAGASALWADTPAARALVAALPAGPRAAHAFVPAESAPDAEIAAVLFEGDGDALRQLNQRLARRDGPILQAQGLSPHDIAAGRVRYAAERLVLESSVSTNTAAAGGNASLMTIG
ncbi:trifunctional transcriptional regulator/proline dehydrogenase/L-glutamate gamma-semialdehyde dehydrogenase [Xylophilus sp.]|uniref:trifunctional transcriptional regulator/proline dehydrogenase/L-glutamate gamma-semialdehyde dehydrogenase n=1 Tax=Xylophilus sp. TaxID=2653893 RepID=UPI0013BDFB05|nr:trifunctional transcriptional regulator/proline dehydrogenase/L-glutamate gamma-semialdehyde dehydrogenase [Xylophilus sp.]KAF1045999.1 MAG: Bifunctional protein PutA [Xylophilus sp.]